MIGSGHLFVLGVLSVAVEGRWVRCATVSSHAPNGSSGANGMPRRLAYWPVARSVSGGIPRTWRARSGPWSGRCCRGPGFGIRARTERRGSITRGSPPGPRAAYIWRAGVRPARWSAPAQFSPAHFYGTGPGPQARVGDPAGRPPACLCLDQRHSAVSTAASTRWEAAPVGAVVTAMPAARPSSVTPPRVRYPRAVPP